LVVCFFLRLLLRLGSVYARFIHSFLTTRCVLTTSGRARGFCCDVVAIDILGLSCQWLLNAAGIVQFFSVFFCFVGLHFAHLERRILSLFEVLKRDRDRIKRFSFSRIV
jgi:hypothetical protein